MTLELIGALGSLAAIIVAFIGLYTANANKKEIQASSAQKISEAAAVLIKPLKDEISELRVQIVLFEDELEQEREKRRSLEVDLAHERGARKELERGVFVLINQLREAGVEPKWEPTRYFKKDD